MGMIVVQETKLSDETEEQYQERLKIENALSNRIYYGNYDDDNKNYKGYYIKESYFDIVPQEGDLDPKPIELADFSLKDYYYTNNHNYYLEKTGYHSGNKYYTLEVSDKQDLIQYKPNIYYYLDDNNNFILSTSLESNDNMEYYESDEQIPSIVKIKYDSGKGNLFVPTSEGYFQNNIFEFYDEDKTGKANKGWFYYDKEADVRKPLTQPLTWL
jgi:hypothetical protein